MNAQKMVSDLQAAGVRFVLDGDGFQVIADRGRVADATRQTLATHKPEIYVMLQTEEAHELLLARCPSCGAVNSCREFVTRWELECTADPLHFSEHRKKPGAAYLWEDVSAAELRHYNLAHLSEAE